MANDLIWDYVETQPRKPSDDISDLRDFIV